MSIVNTITEGGQLATHSLRMLKQVFKIIFFITIILWGSLFLYCMSRLPYPTYQIAWYYLKASTAMEFNVQSIEIDEKIWKKLSGQILKEGEKISPERILIKTQPIMNHLTFFGLHYAKNTGWLAFGVFSLVLLLFFIRGRLSLKKYHISGNKIAPAWKIALSLKLTGKASDIKIGKLPLIKGTETQHILVTGGTGSGKTNCFHHLLPQIRSRKQRAVIIDTTGIFIDRYYKEGRDVILNPFDSRTAQWSPWIECQDRFDYEAIAESFIPQTISEHDNYWHTAARSLLSSILIKLEKDPSISELTRWILFEPLSKLAAYVQGTKAGAHIDVSSERTAGSVRSVASSFLGCLEFLPDTTAPFSIRQWIDGGEEGGWLFLSCKPSQRSALNPLLSCWFSIAMRSLLQLEQNLSRKIWFIIDELPTLNRLKDLESFLAEGRKYGGCALLALQSPAQLESIYGPEVARTIIGNCGTKIVFSEQDPEIAQKISRAFGEREIKEYQKGLSYGANDVRDGVNLTLQTKQQPLISPTAIQFLKRNQAFIRLPGNHPITKIKLKITKNKR